MHLHDMLDDISTGLSAYPIITLLDVNIDDYSESIMTNDFALIQIDEAIHLKLLEIWSLLGGEGVDEKILYEVKYILGSRFFDDARVESHLSNRFSKSTVRTQACIVSIDNHYCDWIYKFLPAETKLNISLDGIADIISISKSRGSEVSTGDVDLKFIIEQIDQMNTQEFLFRGIYKYYRDDDGIASSIYRINKDLLDFDDLQDHEQQVADSLLRKQYNKAKTYAGALTELRHLGKDTSFIDFSEDAKVALFFACYRSSDARQPGEFIYFNKTDIEKKDDVHYPIDRDFVIHPIEAELTACRIRAQKSVFVYAHQGYLPRYNYGNKLRHLLIHPLLKPMLMKYSNLTEDHIYPDMMGFCDNPENFETPIKLLLSAKKLMDRGGFRDFEKALYKLKNCHDRVHPDWKHYAELREKTSECEKIVKEIEKKLNKGRLRS